MAAIGTAALAMAAPPAARAALMLSDSLTDLTTSATAAATFTDNQPDDANPAPGILSLGSNYTPLPNFVVNGSIHTAIGIPAVPGSSDMLTSGSSSVVNNSADAIHAIVSVSATGFSPAGLLALASGSGTFTGAGNTITMKWYDDPTNTQGANSATDTPGTLLHTFTFTSTATDLSFSDNASNIAVNDPNPFSMTLQFDYTLLAGDSLISRGQSEAVVPSVPEPGSLLLLGSGLLGLGLIRARNAI